MKSSIQNTSGINRIGSLIAMLGVIAPAAYLMGVNYYQGQLSVYGINADLFAIPAQDAYINAYYAVAFYLMALTTLIMELFKFLFYLPNLYVTALVLFVLVILIYSLIKLSKKTLKFKIKKWFVKLRKLLSLLHWSNNDFTKAIGVAGLASYGLLSVLYILMLLSIFWLVLPMAAYYKSIELTEEKRTKFLQHGCYIKEGDFWSNCKVLRSDSGAIIYEGLLVAHTEKYVAFFTKKGAFVTPYPKGAVIISSFSESTNKI